MIQTLENTSVTVSASLKEQTPKLELYELIDEDGSIKFKPNEMVFGEDNLQVLE
jgi:hypothetical protein